MNTTLTPEIRRAERNAIYSSCCGVTGEAVLTDSAVILLYAVTLGAGDSLSLFTTAVLPLLNGLLILPMAGFAPRFGSRKLVINANLFALAGYWLVAAAAFAGRWSVPVMLGGILLFSICQTGFVAGWFPMLDSFLAPQRRTLFLGRMRFFHQISAVAFLGILSALIGRAPDVHVLQIVLFAAGCIFAGRIFFICRIPPFPECERVTLSYWQRLRTAARNRPLTLFSGYSFLLNCAMFGIVPLMLLCFKSRWNFADDELLLVSAAAFAGMPAGYLTAHQLCKKLGEYGIFIGIHLLLLVDLLILFKLMPGGIASRLTATGCLMICNFCIAANSVVAGARMMSLVTPGNKTLAMAFWGAFYYGGGGAARLGGAFLLGTGIFAQNRLPMNFDRFDGVLLVSIFLTLLGGIFLLFPALWSVTPAKPSERTSHTDRPESTAFHPGNEV